MAAPETNMTIKKGAIKASEAAKATFRQAGSRLRKVAITRTTKDKKIKRSKTKTHAAKQRSSRQKP
jgi:proline dehydrogenase